MSTKAVIHRVKVQAKEKKLDARDVTHLVRIAEINEEMKDRFIAFVLSTTEKDTSPENIKIALGELHGHVMRLTSMADGVAMDLFKREKKAKLDALKAESAKKLKTMDA